MYSFTDEILVDVLIQNIDQEKFVAHHLFVGQIMENIYSQRINEHAAEIAQHFQKGAGWQKCFEYSSKAGDFAASTNGHSEAAKHFTMALQALEELGGIWITASRACS